MRKTILLDENFPLSTRSFLESRGWAILDVRGTSREGCEDKVLFAWGQENHALILTTDKDFFHTIPLLFGKHFGIVVVALKKPNSMAILHRLLSAWNHLEQTGFENQAYLLTDTRIYSRRT